MKKKRKSLLHYLKKDNDGDYKFFFFFMLFLFFIFVGAGEYDFNIKSFIGFMLIPLLFGLAIFWGKISDYLKQK